MDPPGNWTACRLADALDDLPAFPHNTAGLSMLDEAAGYFDGASPEVAEARRVFGRARCDHKYGIGADGSCSEDAWDRAMDAAARLAAALRALGPALIEVRDGR